MESLVGAVDDAPGSAQRRRDRERPRAAATSGVWQQSGVMLSIAVPPPGVTHGQENFRRTSPRPPGHDRGQVVSRRSDPDAGRSRSARHASTPSERSRSPGSPGDGYGTSHGGCEWPSRGYSFKTPSLLDPPGRAGAPSDDDWFSRCIDTDAPVPAKMPDSSMKWLTRRRSSGGGASGRQIPASGPGESVADGCPRSGRPPGHAVRRPSRRQPFGATAARPAPPGTPHPPSRVSPRGAARARRPS